MSGIRSVSPTQRASTPANGVPVATIMTKLEPPAMSEMNTLPVT